MTKPIVEIYEFLLEDYPINLDDYNIQNNSNYQIVTKKIVDANNKCGKITTLYRDINIKNNQDIKIIRNLEPDKHCDPIEGELDVISDQDTKSQPDTDIMFNFNINNLNLSSKDLSLYIGFNGSKIVKPVDTTNIPELTNFYKFFTLKNINSIIEECNFIMSIDLIVDYILSRNEHQYLIPLFDYYFKKYHHPKLDNIIDINIINDNFIIITSINTTDISRINISIKDFKIKLLKNEELFSIFLNIINKNINLTDLDNLLDESQANNSYIKVIKNNDVNNKFIVFGDFHGSLATFVRHLFRFKVLGIIDGECKLMENYNLIFLGDIVDRGIYGLEILTLIYMLKILNPNQVFINRGNHEELYQNRISGFYNEIINKPYLIKYLKDMKIELYNKINNLFKYQHSGLLLKYPSDNKYIFMAHGGFPTNEIDLSNPDPIINLHKNFTDALTKTDLPRIILLDNNTIRWNDYQSIETSTRGFRGDTSIVIGKDLIEAASKLHIELTIRGHNDLMYNTKMLDINIKPKHPHSPQFIDINTLDPERKTCSNYPINYRLTIDKPNIQLNENDAIKYIIVNDENEKEFLPVLTISNNTDTNRDLNKDSYVIINFNSKCSSEIELPEKEMDEQQLKIFRKRQLSPIEKKYLKYKLKYLKLKRLLS